MVIRTIVVARTREEAISAATNVFERLTENQHPFDYFQTFDDEGTSVSGKGRYGDIPAALEVSTKEGRQMVSEGMSATRRDFFEALKGIKSSIRKFNQEELFQGVSKKKLTRDEAFALDFFKHSCYKAGQYAGSNVWLYDGDGEGIRDDKHLNNVLNNWDRPLADGEKLWVVPADVHF